MRNAANLPDIDASCGGKVEKTAPSDRICRVIVGTTASHVRLASLQTGGHIVGCRQTTATEHVTVYVDGPRCITRL